MIYYLRLYMMAFFCFMTTIVQGQIDTSYFFFQDEFLYNSNIYEIKSQHLGTQYKFILRGEDSTESFYLYNLTNFTLFHSKFTTSLLSIEKKIDKKYERFLVDLNSILAPKGSTDTFSMMERTNLLSWRDDIVCNPNFEIRELRSILDPSKLSSQETTFITEYLEKAEEDNVTCARLLKTAQEEELENLAYPLLTKIKDADTRDKANAPTAGIFFIAPTTTIYKKKTDTGVNINIENVEIEFFDNSIYNIKVKGYVGNTLLLFENKIPISYSRKSDVNFKKEQKIFIANANKYKNIIYAETHLKISQVISLNDYTLDLFTENYSPKNGIVTFTPHQNGKVLFKKNTKNLFSVNVFSDFIGIGEQANNGLIQTELESNIPLFTKFTQIGRSNYLKCFSSLSPKIVVSKIENKNRKLQLGTLTVDSVLSRALIQTYPRQTAITNNQADTTSLFVQDSTLYYASFMDVYRYQTFSFGVDLNVLTWGLPFTHLKVFLDGGMHLNIYETEKVLNTTTGNTTVISTKDTVGAALQLYPSISILASPDSRWQFQFKYSWIFYQVFSNYQFLPTFYKQKVDQGDYSGFEKQAFSSIHSFEGKITYRASPSSTFFGRVRYNFTGGNVNEHFWQAQVGVSVDFNIPNNKK